MQDFDDIRPVQRNGVLVGLCGWVVGIALQMRQPQLWDVAAYGALLLLAALVYLLGNAASLPGPAVAAIGGAYRKRFLASVAPYGVLFVVCALLGFCSTGLRAQNFLSSRLDTALEGKDIRITAVVAGLPQRNLTGLRFRLDVESAELDGQPVAIPARIDVGWYGGLYPSGGGIVGLQRAPLDVQAGERWSMTVRLKAPHGSRNPHGFDYELWLWQQGVQATGYVRAGVRDAPAIRLAQTGRYPVTLARQQLRDRIVRTVEDRQAAGLLAALVVGDQAAIDRADWDVFRATGVAHLVSISGVHITMFAWLAALIIQRLWRRFGRLCLAIPAPTAALCGGVLAACGYAVFSGWGVPAQRTCLMLATVCALHLLGARWPWPSVWMLCCAMVVAFDPWALLQAGFWLSFVAVGVLFATAAGDSPDMRHMAASRQAWSLRLVHHLRAGLHEQWAISIVLAPLCLLLFGQVSLVGLWANVLAIPWVTLLVTPLAMLGAFIPWLWDAAALAMHGLMVVLEALAALPWATVALPVAPLGLVVCAVIGGLLVVVRLPWRVRMLGLPLFAPVVLWQAPTPSPGHFELLAADVGQGNAVLVRTATHALLFDAGPRYSLESDAGHRVLLPLMQALQTRLNMLVLSHRDSDHVGGALAVLTMQPQAHVLSSMDDASSLPPLTRPTRCLAGQNWHWDGVHFEILHPSPQDYDIATRPNTVSCVLRITNGQQTALLTGDIESAQEAALVANGASIRADVLLVPHHGSKTSSSAAFLDAVQPTWAVVQTGYRNRFGHPSADVMSRYAERQVRVQDSPHCGAATWRSAQPQQLECTRIQQQRYWHHAVP